MVKKKKNKRILKKKKRIIKIIKKKPVRKQKALKKTKKRVIKVKPKKIKKKRQKKIKSVIPENAYQTKIKVIGIGGGGGSIISEIASQLKKASFTAANTDTQALKRISKKCRRFSFGRSLTGGLGCGMNPDLGRKAAQQAADDIKKILDGADLCILVSSLGGGTGSGASPVFTQVSQELKNITFGIFTLPFKFEGEKKLKIALNSLEKMKPNLNAFTVIPNEKIFKIIDKKTPLKQSLSALNKILEQGLEGLIEMIFLPGLINIDWADLKVILEGRGKLCYLNSVEARSDEEPEEIVMRLIQNPLSEYNPEKADKILYNITSDKDLKMDTVQQISKAITGINKRAKIIFGISQHPNYKKKIRITLLATSDEKKELKIKKKQNQKVKIVSEPEEKPAASKKAPASPRRRRGESLAPPGRKPEKKLKKKQKPKVAKIILEKPKEKIFKLKKKKPKKKKAVQRKVKKAKKKKPPAKRKIKKQEKTRKNALQLKREAEEAEKELLEEEKKWDIPAFLRKNTGNNQ
ncbi:cell division FtsZ family protein [Candidatus Parcubacteria bacterium]|nr:cell division FtsZ family protein [Candidatus Parcubacteria bacterium]